MSRKAEGSTRNNLNNQQMFFLTSSRRGSGRILSPNLYFAGDNVKPSSMRIDFTTGREEEEDLS